MELTNCKGNSIITLTPAEVCKAVYGYVSTRYDIPKECEGLILAIASKVREYNMPSIAITITGNIEPIVWIK